MKKLFALMLILSLALALAACTANPTVVTTPATEVPAVTDAPAATDAPAENTAEPTARRKLPRPRPRTPLSPPAMPPAMPRPTDVLVLFREREASRVFPVSHPAPVIFRRVFLRGFVFSVSLGPACLVHAVSFIFHWAARSLPFTRSPFFLWRLNFWPCASRFPRAKSRNPLAKALVFMPNS